MRHDQRKTAKLISKRKWRTRWQKAISILAIVTVFTTTYAMVLPAITASTDTYCGKEEHKHTEDCYTRELICGFEEAAPDAAEAPVAEEAKTVKTVVESVLVDEGHAHTEECYEEVRTLVCGQEEKEAVYEAVYETVEGETEETAEEVLAEEVLVEEGHTHSDECYEIESVLVCEEEEREATYEDREVEIEVEEEEKTEVEEAHQHTDACYEEVLSCDKEEHQHDKSCYEEPVAEGVLKAEGNGYSVSLGYSVNAGIPEGATLSVKEITEKSADYQAYNDAAAEEVYGQAEDLPYARFFDITILNKKGEEIEPKAPVTVAIDLKDNALKTEDVEFAAIHFVEEKKTIETEVMDITTDDVVAFDADSFSVYGVVYYYTVDFYYTVTEATDDKEALVNEYHLAGGTEMMMSQLFSELGIEKSTADIEKVEFTDDSLIAFTKSGSDYRISSLQPFQTAEVLTITFNNGDVVVIGVEDEQFTGGLDSWSNLAQKVAAGDDLDVTFNWPMVANSTITVKNGQTVKLSAGSGANADMIYCASGANFTSGGYFLVEEGGTLILDGITFSGNEYNSSNRVGDAHVWTSANSGINDSKGVFITSSGTVQANNTVFENIATDDSLTAGAPIVINGGTAEFTGSSEIRNNNFDSSTLISPSEAGYDNEWNNVLSNQAFLGSQRNNAPNTQAARENRSDYSEVLHGDHRTGEGFWENTSKTLHTVGGILINGGSVTATGLKIDNNMGSVGAVMVRGGGSFTQDGTSSISNNRAVNGAVTVASGTYNLNGGSVAGNRTVTYGAISATEPNSYVNIGTGSATPTISGNQTYHKGGGIYINSSNVNLSKALIENNQAQIFGGGIYVEIGRIIKLSDTVITGNTAKLTDMNGNTLADNKTNGSISYCGWEMGHGGGYWSCPTGETYFSGEDVALYGNTASPVTSTGNMAGNFNGHAGSDFFSVNRGIQNFISEDTWYDENNNNQSVNTIDQMTGIYGYGGNPSGEGNTERIALRNSNTSVPSDNAQKIIIRGNTAPLGGGVGSNGNMYFVEEFNQVEAKLNFTKAYEGTAWHNVRITVTLKDAAGVKQFEESKEIKARGQNIQFVLPEVRYNVKDIKKNRVPAQALAYEALKNMGSSFIVGDNALGNTGWTLTISEEVDLSASGNGSGYVPVGNANYNPVVSTYNFDLQEDANSTTHNIVHDLDYVATASISNVEKVKGMLTVEKQLDVSGDAETDPDKVFYFEVSIKKADGASGYTTDSDSVYCKIYDKGGDLITDNSFTFPKENSANEAVSVDLINNGDEGARRIGGLFTQSGGNSSSMVIGLKAGQKISFHNIPMGSLWTVKEKTISGSDYEFVSYETTVLDQETVTTTDQSAGVSGTFTTTDSAAKVVANNKEVPGTFELGKQLVVSGAEGESLYGADQEFQFVLCLHKDDLYNGWTYEEDGVYFNILDSNGQPITDNDHLAADYGQYDAQVGGRTDISAMATGESVYDSVTNRDFSIKDGNTGAMLVTLKAGQKIKFYNLPLGTLWGVREINNSNYNPAYRVDGESVEISAGNNIVGSVSGDDRDVTVEAVNTEKVGSLELKKEVAAGTNFDPETQFRFKVTIDGVEQIVALKNNGTQFFENLKLGSQWSIEEIWMPEHIRLDKYTVNGSDAEATNNTISGTIADESRIAVVAKNEEKDFPELKLIKVDATDDNKKLDGAEFQIWVQSTAGSDTPFVNVFESDMNLGDAGSLQGYGYGATQIYIRTYNALNSSGGAAGKFLDDTGFVVGANGKYLYNGNRNLIRYMPDYRYVDNADVRNVNKVYTSGASGVKGEVNFGKLPDGTYYIVETKAPEKYNPLTGAITVTVSNGTISVQGVPQNKVSTSGNTTTVLVQNTSGVALPQAGGMGTRVFTVTGLVLLIGAASCLVVRRRVKNGR